MSSDTLPRTGVGSDDAASRPKRRLANIVPLGIFALIAIAFAIGLTLDPRIIPSVLIGEPVPEFDLPPVQENGLGLATEDLKGQVSLVNVWASWCTECRREHPLFMRIAREQIVPLNGINYKDRPEDARGWLNELGDPYTRNGADRNGRVAIDWGVYGVPETFVIDKSGRIAYKHIGALNEKVLKDSILPLIEKLKQDGS